MKAKIWALAAIVLALSLSAFTARQETHQAKGNLYWFPLDPSSGRPLAVQTLVYQSYDPYECSSWGAYDYCAGGYTSYTTNGSLYVAQGFEVLLHYMIYP
jgi:hypothetical protein